MSPQPMRPFGTRPAFQPEPTPASDRAIDLVHLSRQTLGDRDLEVELLSLFEKQAAQVIQRLKQASGNGERRWKHDLAHTLKGSARAVGAGRVASVAQAYEEVLFSAAAEPDIARVLTELERCVEEARAAALDFLADH
jgi:HPt (histidine-containing phosphotransfer) domain-containing protein